MALVARITSTASEKISELPKVESIRRWRRPGSILARSIREYGTKEQFGKNRYIKLELDSWKYWSMGGPVKPDHAHQPRQGRCLDAAAAAQA